MTDHRNIWTPEQLDGLPRFLRAEFDSLEWPPGARTVASIGRVLRAPTLPAVRVAARNSLILAFCERGVLAETCAAARLALQDCQDDLCLLRERDRDVEVIASLLLSRDDLESWLAALRGAWLCDTSNAAVGEAVEALEPTARMVDGYAAQQDASTEIVRALRRRTLPDDVRFLEVVAGWDTGAWWLAPLVVRRLPGTLEVIGQAPGPRGERGLPQYLLGFPADPGFLSQARNIVRGVRPSRRLAGSAVGLGPSP
jgi:hypothetical protein